MFHLILFFSFDPVSNPVICLLFSLLSERRKWRLRHIHVFAEEERVGAQILILLLQFFALHSGSQRSLLLGLVREWAGVDGSLLSPLSHSLPSLEGHWSDQPRRCCLTTATCEQVQTHLTPSYLFLEINLTFVFGLHHLNWVLNYAWGYSVYLCLSVSLSIYLKSIFFSI